MAQLNHNTAEYPAQDRDVLPAGDYPLFIDKTDMKPTKGGDGEYLQIEYSVLEGPHKGRKLWDRLNLKNKNQTAVDIAKRTLTAICNAVGITGHIRDSEELHGKMLVAKVAVKSQQGFADTNEIKSYKPISGAAPAASAPAAQAAKPAAPATAAATPPWKKTASA